MYKAILLPLAKQDIKEAAKWYNKKQDRLGKRFTVQVRQKINVLKREPFTAAIRYDDVRTAVLDVFPYMVHYSVDDPTKTIIVTAVLHTSRNPDLWGSKSEIDRL